MAPRNPLGNNGTRPLAYLFAERKYYDQVITPYILNKSEVSPFSDLIYRNSLYGLVDSDLDIIEPIISNEFLTNLKASNGKRYFLQNFVYDAFNELKNFITDAVLVGKYPYEGLYSNISINKAGISVDNYLNEYRRQFASNFRTHVMNDVSINYTIKNHTDFIKHYLSYLRIQSRKGKIITKSSYMLRTNFIGLSNFLSFNLFEEKGGNDNLNYTKYFNTEEFDTFKTYCARYGFTIDISMPWRLTADLNSPAMKQDFRTPEFPDLHLGYLKRYSLNNVEDLFSARYKKIYIDELENLKNFIYDSYNIFLENNFYFSDGFNKSCNRDNLTRIERPRLDRETFMQDLSDSILIKPYIYFRNQETKKGLTQQKFNNISREALAFIFNDKKEDAMKYINDIFKDFKNVVYFSPLQQKNPMLEDSASNSSLPEIVY